MIMGFFSAPSSGSRSRFARFPFPLPITSLGTSSGKGYLVARLRIGVVGLSLPADGPIMKAYNSNKKVQVIVQPQVSLDGGKNYIDIPNDKPDTLPFETGTDEGKPLMYKYV